MTIPLIGHLPLPIPVSSARSGGDAEGAASLGATGDDGAAEGFVALLAALMQAPVPPPPSSQGFAENAGGYVAGSVTADEDGPASTAAAILDVTFSATESIRHVVTTNAAAPYRAAARERMQALAHRLPQRPLTVVPPSRSSSPTEGNPLPLADLLPVPIEQLVQSEITATPPINAIEGAPAGAAKTSSSAVAGTILDGETLGGEISVEGDVAAPGMKGDLTRGEDVIAKMKTMSAVTPQRSANDSAHVDLSPAIVLPKSAGVGSGEGVSPSEVSREAATVAAIEDAEPVSTSVPRTGASAARHGNDTVIAPLFTSQSNTAGDRRSNDQAPWSPPRDHDENGDLAPTAAMSSNAGAEAPSPLAVSAPVVTSRPASPSGAGVAVPEQAPLPPRESAAPQVPPDQAMVVLDRGDGSDRIRVSVRGSTVHATILTEPAHHEALATRVDDLRRALGDRGFTDARVAVRLAPTMGEGAPAPIAVAAAPEAPTEKVSAGRSGGSSQEYSSMRQRHDRDDAPDHPGRRRSQEEELE